ncbi:MULTISPECIES: RDD family protein [unclassified Pseudomonas]|uniref:RDD family protein n=1 Tax=unclassified Pseudomonas TaxID=196821 RepID=UPI000A1E3A02|nr:MULTISPECIES: RDD family protein [unclassified Pseudomonas]
MFEPSAPPRKAPLVTPQDTRHQVETPEGIDLPLRPAGLPVRAVAFAIDLALRGAALGVLFMALAALGRLGMGLGSLLLFGVSWWYMVLFEVLRQGRSPGKQWMGLRVVHDDGTPVGWSASLLRNLLRVVDLMPFGYFLGALSCLQHPTFKRLGDIAAGTLVVYGETPPRPPSLPEAVPRRCPAPLTLSEQRALLGFAERQSELSPARVNELAALLAQPLHISAPKAVGELNGIARGLLGPT